MDSCRSTYVYDFLSSVKHKKKIFWRIVLPLTSIVWTKNNDTFHKITVSLQFITVLNVVSWWVVCMNTYDFIHTFQTIFEFRDGPSCLLFCLKMLRFSTKHIVRIHTKSLPCKMYFVIYGCSKYIILVFIKETKSHRFGTTTQGWINYDIIFNFRWTFSSDQICAMWSLILFKQEDRGSTCSLIYVKQDLNVCRNVAFYDTT